MRVGGEIQVPGDKSLTHRALMLGALAKGTSFVRGALTSLDARSTARVLRQLGAAVSPLTPGRVTRIEGRGRFRRPDATLNCGNSGTTTRLLLGLLAAHPMRVTLTGDSSLRRRPMRRVTVPLSEMGARFSQSPNDGLPLTITGGKLRPLRHQLPVSSAQIKSCLLLAGLAGRVQVELREPTGRSRDHTERLLRAFGYLIEERDGWLTFEPTGKVTPFEMEIPGDPSSAAFPVGAALLAESGELRVSRVCLNPTRTGFLRVLERMGGRVAAEDIGPQFDEPVGALVAGPSPLIGTEVSAEEIPGLIDEIPLLAALATRARGTTIFRDVAELRVKESDRLDLIASNIRALGGTAEISGDDIYVSGGDQPPRGMVRTAGDHRIAMAFAVLGTVRGARVRVDDMDCAAVSFPGFREMLKSIRR
ncbi:MAG TPA: 3-phosphoshikimate 1-carboxyvinyltransferase [Gemmatimonadales bacterium]|nr:3-phosphoshikimate 1-carboxyvinyltransferase [Gemmatimonadales bacterium]